VQPIDLTFDASAAMHDYALDWTYDKLTFSIDGKPTASENPVPFRDAPPMYLIVNLAVGGSWGGNPNAQTRFPATMQIAYIHMCRADSAR
jgi:beta-glucanase (GH16 family)